jgi:hypothetical protein
MSEQAYHKRLRLQNFTVFVDATFDFVPGINVFVGENGTGKTHVMKALYATQLACSRKDYVPREIFAQTFQIENPFQLTRLGADAGAIAQLMVHYGGRVWEYDIRETAYPHKSDNMLGKVERPVFIPAIDMMGHTKGFVEAYSEVRLDFDRTYLDIVTLLRLERKNGHHTALLEQLAQLLGGEIERDEEGRFYLVTQSGRLPMPLVAEGLRKIATLIQLQRNGWLSPGTTLFWDEPEVNLNPTLMDELIQALLALARDGVQIFLATHSYVILKELDLQGGKEDNVQYFGFQRNDTEGTMVNATDNFALLHPNPILDQYDSLYDRELTRSTGRNRHGERVR